ncbi:hypothetical protein CGZ93_13455 [Enemella dayhoffiae]|uniref:Uncharacterized protein n=1 Tax=Enemella dayhoffiae TaxID=2016507 RepID=A0A255GUM0_9ACTN|nr:hypothetical protein CGZ93_13455 [Enemella dayhoffiae]
MDGVGTSIVGRSRRLPADRRARPTYTLIWEEPDSLVTPLSSVSLSSFGPVAGSNRPPTVLPATLVCPRSRGVTWRCSQRGLAATITLRWGRSIRCCGADAISRRHRIAG